MILGMSASADVDLKTILDLVRNPGGELFPESRGWGFAIRQDTASRIIREDSPVHGNPTFSAWQGRRAATDVLCLEIIEGVDNRESISFADVGPFERELWGAPVVFAQSGYLSTLELDLNQRFSPKGKSAAEEALCFLLNEVSKRNLASPIGRHPSDFLGALGDATTQLNQFGTTNYIMIVGDLMLVHAHLSLFCIWDTCPETESATGLSGGKNQVVVSTLPLDGANEHKRLPANTLSVFRHGELIARMHTSGAAEGKAKGTMDESASTFLRRLTEAKIANADAVARYGEHQYESG